MIFISSETLIDFSFKISSMPLFMDFHNDMQGVSHEDAANAHVADMEIQDKYGVKYHKFWVNEDKGFVFCLIEGPSKEACEKVHRLSHGHVACEIVEVSPTDVASFMGPGQTTPIGQAVHPDGKYDSAVRTFLFTDIVGSTAMTQEFGDTAGIKILHTHNKIVRHALGKYSGKEIKHTGDGIMACFSSASKAVLAAKDIQGELKKYRQEEGNLPLHVKIGINSGEPVTEGGDFFGAAVQLTARLCDLSEADQILTATVVRDLCLGKMLRFDDVGKVQLKGFSEPVHICEVDWK